MPRHTVTAPLLWALLAQLLKGDSVKACAERLRLPFALETLYHLLQRLRQKLDVIRSRLFCRQAPPASAQVEPLQQTLEHALAVFPHSSCPVVDYQLSFGSDFLG